MKWQILLLHKKIKQKGFENIYLKHFQNPFKVYLLK